LSVIAVVLAVIAALLMMVLLFPVTIYISSVRTGGKIDGSFDISWIVLQFRYALRNKQVEILFFGRHVTHVPGKKKQPEAAGKPEKKKKKRTGRMPPIGDILNLSIPALRLFIGLVRAFRLKYFDIYVTFGAGDPGYTGMLAGYLYAIQGSSCTGHNIRWSADFTRQILDWNMRAKISLIPVRMLPPVAGFVTSNQVLRSGLHIIREIAAG